MKLNKYLDAHTISKHLLFSLTIFLFFTGVYAIIITLEYGSIKERLALTQKELQTYKIISGKNVARQTILTERPKLFKYAAILNVPPALLAAVYESENGWPFHDFGVKRVRALIQRFFEDDAQLIEAGRIIHEEMLHFAIIKKYDIKAERDLTACAEKNKKEFLQHFLKRWNYDKALEIEPTLLILWLRYENEFFKKQTGGGNLPKYPLLTFAAAKAAVVSLLKLERAA